MTQAHHGGKDLGSASKPHSTRQDFLALRNALTLLNRELATPSASSLANEGYAALGRLEEQLEAAQKRIAEQSEMIAISTRESLKREEQLEAQEKALRAIADGSWGASAPPLYDVREFALNALKSNPASSPDVSEPETIQAWSGPARDGLTRASRGSGSETSDPAKERP